MNKTQAILNHLKNYKKITSMEAFELYGATRLSAIIYQLRHHYELNIINEPRTCIDRYGKACYFDAYVLVEEPNEKD